MRDEFHTFCETCPTRKQRPIFGLSPYIDEKYGPEEAEKNIPNGTS
jgi:hypothetical protein